LKKPTTDVEVRIMGGAPYIAPPMSCPPINPNDDPAKRRRDEALCWRFYVPGHTISFMPIDYEYGEDRNGIAEMPIFRNARNSDGTYPNGFWLQPRLPTDKNHPLYNGGTSGLRFYYLQVEYYSLGGVSIDGHSERDDDDERYNPPLRVRAGAGLNGNTFFGMVFTNLGTRYAGDAEKFGYGAIVLTNSSNNKIENNHFVRIENKRPHEVHIHGLYITHFSSNNSIRNNQFVKNSGEPVKVRNMSNFNAVEHNTFIESGVKSFYRDEFCNQQCAIEHKQSRQCASYHNRFFYNKLISDYRGGDSSESWTLEPPGLTYPGMAGCSIPAGDQRLRTGGNTVGPSPDHDSCPQGTRCCERGPTPGTCHLCYPESKQCP
jgi:hypothetical protein